MKRIYFVLAVLITTSASCSKGAISALAKNCSTYTTQQNGVTTVCAQCADSVATQLFTNANKKALKIK